MEVDNFDLISSYMNFDDDDHYYYILILLRKKDDNKCGCRQNSRQIKYFCISSLQSFEDKKEDIKKLCNTFNARAYISLSQKSYKYTAIKLLEIIAEQFSLDNFKVLKDSYLRAIQRSKNMTKTWVIDIDDKNDDSEKYENFINDFCLPIGNKIICKVPTVHGYHIITSPFNLLTFKNEYPNIEVKKENFTLLYYNEQNKLI